MPRKKIAMSELRRLKTGSKQPISFESADDLPLIPDAVWNWYERNKQTAIMLSMGKQEIVRAWYCHNCKRIVFLAESEQPDLPIDALLTNCVRCGAKAAARMAVFGQNLNPAAMGIK